MNLPSYLKVSINEALLDLTERLADKEDWGGAADDPEKLYYVLKNYFKCMHIL